MGILISEIRIRNYKSLKNVNLILNENNVFVGQNNAGKTSILQAIQIALAGIRHVSSKDVYVEKNEELPRERRILIDILIIPVDHDGNRLDEFEEKWFEHFGDMISNDTTTFQQLVAMRTIIELNSVSNEYEIQRKCLIEWPNVEEMESYEGYQKKAKISTNILQSIPVFYLDAKRDIVAEMRDSSSYWGKMINHLGIEKEKEKEIEESMQDINEQIMQESEVVRYLEKELDKISATVNSEEESIKIHPIARKINDISRGMDITFMDKDSERFSISTQGMGTRSWITFLTLFAYISWKNKQMKGKDLLYHPIILLEEPEAHLHPQAQRQVFKQMSQLVGQRIISSHSSLIVGQVNINEVAHVGKKAGCTYVDYLDTSDLGENEVRRIKQEIFKTRGDILFAKAFILCEGETEEVSLPIFFKEYFGVECFEIGISIINVRGKGNYKPFLRVAKEFNIECFILSDSEPETIKKVNKDFSEVFGIDSSNNVVFLNEGCDFEKYLLEEGYNKELLVSIERIYGAGYLDVYINAKNGKSKGRVKTEETCSECGQNIYKDVMREYFGEEGKSEALLDCIHENKTAYASMIADIILELREEEKIPEKIKLLFKLIERCLEIDCKEEYKDEYKDEQYGGIIAEAE